MSDTPRNLPVIMNDALTTDREALRRKELAREIKRARGFRSQEEYASALGISRPHVSDLENGKAEPRQFALVRNLIREGVPERMFDYLLEATA